MLRNYFKIAWRNLKKNTFYSFISIFGLALGMSCSFLIWLWVQDEISYNRFYEDHGNIYFVRCNGTFNGELFTNPVTPYPLADAIKKDVPEVAYAAKLAWNNNYLISVGENSGKESGLYASEDLFDVFQIPVVEGNPRAALASPSQIVISRKLAEKYFGNTSAVGKTLRLNNEKDYLVGAIIENIPLNSSERFDWVVNYKEIEADWMQRWGNNFLHTYVRLHPHTTPENAEASMKDIYPRYADMDMYPILQPLKDVYLYGDYKNGVPVGGRIEYVRIFMLVAFFILLIACINFMNLATARSSLRAREVGVRKVMGAARRSLIRQFISESILTSLLALVLAMIMVRISLPVFNRFFEKEIRLDFSDPLILGSIVGLLTITGILSGSYPALYLSAMQPVRVLRNNLKLGFSTAFFRKALVVFQFTLSIFLIIGMVVIAKQMQYTRSKNLGLDRERVLYIPLEGELFTKLETFRQEILQSPSIDAATTANMLPINIQASSGDLTWPGKDPELQTNVSVMKIGYDFVETMNIELNDGRDFSKEFTTDSAAYLINESAAKLMGMGNPVGQQIEFWNGKAPVIGVMKDFHMQSLHMPITPLILVLAPSESWYLLVKTRAGKTKEAIDDLKQLTGQFNPNYPFEYHFLDEEYEQLYKSDRQVSILIRYFGTLAILISALGLLALAAFTAEQRTKEIGIRKVLGASVGNVVTLLSRDFMKLVLLGMIIAFPFAWYAMNRWLENFAYRVELEWWMFALAGLLAVGIALLTVSFQSVKAALMNPVKSLRSE